MSNSNVEQYVKMLGKKAKDKVTGFTGILASVSFDLYGCIQAVLTPPLDKDGKMQTGQWFDYNRLEFIEETPVMPVPAYKAPATHQYGPTEKPVR